MAWPINYTPMSQAHTPVLTGYASTSTGPGGNTVAVAVDPTNGAILTEVVSGGGGGGGNVNLTQVGGATYALGQTTASGSIPVVINSDTLLSTAANQTNGSQTTQVTDGTNTANVVAGDTGFNGVATASATKTYTFTTSASGAQTLLADTPTEGFAYATIIYSSVGSGLAATGQFSATSGGIYTAGYFAPPNGIVTQNIASVSTWYIGSVLSNFFRINVTALTSGTFTGIVVLSNKPYTYDYISAFQSGTWTVGSNSATGSAVPANGFYISGNSNTGNLQGIGTMGRVVGNPTQDVAIAAAAVGQARISSPTATANGNQTVATMDVMGEQLVATGGLVTTAVAVSASNTVVKAGAGRLCRVIVTTTGVTPMLIYDNATTNSGTIIGALPASPAVGSFYDFQMPAANGITVAGSATNPAVTISWI